MIAGTVAIPGGAGRRQKVHGKMGQQESPREAYTAKGSWGLIPAAESEDRRQKSLETDKTRDP
jgi:hypothetical protein